MKLLREIGEHEVVNYILELVDEVAPGRDDDAHVFKDKHLLKIDGFAIHNSMLPWNTFYDMGWKTVTMVTSDLVSKGAKPIAFVSSIGVSPEARIDDVLEIIRGIRDSSHYYNSKFIGGDINSSLKDTWIDVAGTGELVVDKPIPRKNHLVEGDYVITTGNYGLTGAAFYAFYKNLDWRTLAKKFKNIFDSTRRPTAALEFLDIVIELREYIKASMDVSDGLAYTLWVLATTNNIAIALENIPLGDEVREFAREHRVNAIELALYGGEEFEVIFIVSSRIDNNLLKQVLEKYNASIIGVVKRGKGVYYQGKLVDYKGWDHFKNI